MQNEMKILFLTNLYPSEQRPDYGVFTKDQIDLVLNSNIVKGDVIVIDTVKEGIFSYWSAFKKVNRIYSQYDLVHAFHGLSLIVAYFSSKKIPILVSFLNAIEYESLKNNFYINSIFTTLYRYIAKKKRVFKIFKDRIPIKPNVARQSFYLPNGVDLDDFYEIERSEACVKLELDVSKRYILFVSSKDKMRHQKRYDIFREVITFVKTTHPNLNVEELILSGVPRNLAIFYYNAAHLHLLTSDYEGSPNSVKEAMACNCPIVARDVGNIREMIDGVDNCYITKSSKPNILGDFLIKCLLSSGQVDLRKNLIEKRLDSISKNEDLLNIYKNIMNKND